MHGNQVPLIIDIIGSSLLLPFENFVEVDKKRDIEEANDEEDTREVKDNVDQEVALRNHPMGKLRGASEALFRLIPKLRRQVRVAKV